MKAYKVLKEFPSSDGGCIHKEGSRYKPTKSASRTANLERLGYIEEIPEQPKTVWDLKEGDNYYFIDTIGNTGGCFSAREEDLKYMRRYREVGNCFLTLKEAENELARRKAKQILLRDTKGFKPDWFDNDQGKYGIAYNAVGDRLIIQVEYGYCFAEIYFATKEDAKASIKTHSDAWKAYLGVEK